MLKYSSDQPRVPAGNPHGGEWTSEGGIGSSDDPSSETSAAIDGGARGPEYAALETDTRTDATDGGGGQVDSDGEVQVAAGTVTPDGLIFQQVPAPDPLDPQRLNLPLSLGEQHLVADALNKIYNGDPKALNPHVYRNLSHDVTGAVLPESANGYTAYDVPGIGSGRGEGRLLVDKRTGAIYYTNNHYRSFYPVQMNIHGE